MPASIRFGRLVAPSRLKRIANLPPGSAFTIMMWIRMVVDTGGMENIFRYLDAGDTVRYIFRLQVGRILGVFNNTSFVTGSTLTVGRWYHVAFVVSDALGICNGYLDGVLDCAHTSGSLSGFTQLWLGDDDTGNYLNGNMAAIKIWNRALPVGEINQERLYALPVNWGGINSAYPVPSGWEAVSSQLIAPRGRSRSVEPTSGAAAARWMDYVGHPATDTMTQEGTLDTESGPPIQWAPSISSYASRTRHIATVAGGAAGKPAHYYRQLRTA